MIKEKFKSCLLVVILSILFLVSMFSIVFLSSCSVKKTILSNDFNIQDDNLNLKNDYILDPNGNLLSDNLFGGYAFNAQINTSIASRDNSNINFNVLGSSYSYVQYVFNNLSSNTFTLSFTSSGSFNIIVESSSNIVLNTSVSSSGYHSYTFSCNGLTYFNFGGVVGNIIINNIMFNVGSSALSYEPYGIWYYGTNLNNPFYNSSLYYYFNLSTSIYGYDLFLNDSLLNGNTFIYPYRALQSKYSSEDLRSYTEETQLGYWRLDFAKPYPVSLLNFKVLCTTTANFDYCITYYFNDGSNYVYHNTISSSLTEFIIDLTEVSNLSDKECIYMTWRRQSSYEINCLSMANYDLGYIDGSNEGYNKALKELDIDSYKTQINDLQQEITDLEYSLERAQERAQNSLDHLTYSMIGAVMSTPFNILHDYLNWNFFGINLFSLFTSLVTLLLIIWVIKFLLGRK